MTIYFISGLGADKRVFQRLVLPPDISVVYIDWIEPLKGESLHNYCIRLSSIINTKEDFVIAGLSFGGIIASELSEIVHPKMTIIISSVPVSSGLPFKYRLIGKLKLHKLIPGFLLKQPTQLTYWFFGAKREGEKKLMNQILSDTSPHFLKWAIDKLVRWNRTNRVKNIHHIHGSIDHLLPVRLVTPDVIVPGAGHLMVYTHADVVSEFIRQKLATLSNV